LSPLWGGGLGSTYRPTIHLRIIGKLDHAVIHFNYIY